MRTGITLGILFTMLPAVGFAAAPGGTVPEPLRGDIVQLIKMTNATQMGQMLATSIAKQLANNLKASHPDISPKAFTIIQDETDKVFSNAATENQLIDRLVPIFAKHYTDQDVRGIIAFYKTPLGQKVIHTNPIIMQAGMQAGEEWGRAQVPALVQRIQERFKQVGIKLDEASGPPKTPASVNQP